MIRPSTDRLHGGIDICPPVLGGGVRRRVQTFKREKGFCSRREYEVKGEDSWLSSCRYDPKGESASTTRADTANANSKAIQDKPKWMSKCGDIGDGTSGPINANVVGPPGTWF